MRKLTLEELPEAIAEFIQEFRDFRNHYENQLDNQQAEQNCWFNLTEFRNYHPNRPSAATVYGWVSRGEVPFHKTEGKKPLRFLKSEIDQWLLTGKHKTISEIERESEDYLKTKGGSR